MVVNNNSEQESEALNDNFASQISEGTSSPEEIIQVFPNPSTGSFYISLTPSGNKLPNSCREIIIFDMFGRQIYSKKIDNESTIQVNYPDLSNGLYYLKIKTQFSETSKIISILK